MMQSSKNNYSAADIERYHSGSMPDAERHALEKAALEDPFLADALEGYSFTSTPAADLQKIRARLEKKSPEKPPVAVFRKMNFLRAAAIILITAGVGWFSYNLLSGTNEKIASEAPLTDKESIKPQDSPSTVSVPAPVPDTTGVASTGTVQTTWSASGNTKAKVAGNQMDSLSSSVTGPSQDFLAGTDSTQGLLANVQEVKTAPVTTSNNAVGNVTLNNASRSPDPSANNMGVYNKARDNRMAPAQVAITNDRLRKQVVDNSLKDSAAARTDLAISGRAEGIELRGVKSAPDTIKNLDVVLKEEKMDMSEVVVVGYGKEKKPSFNRNQSVRIDTLEPAEGIARFDEYIATNLKKPDELKDKTQAGEVQLSFEVNKNGEPVNITVVKSLCDKCDEEAIRLLKEGPLWKKKKNKKGKITIRF